jgi:hypothetical protein
MVFPGGLMATGSMATDRKNMARKQVTNTLKSLPEKFVQFVVTILSFGYSSFLISNFIDSLNLVIQR